MQGHAGAIDEEDDDVQNHEYDADGVQSMEAEWFWDAVNGIRESACWLLATPYAQTATAKFGSVAVCTGGHGGGEPSPGEVFQRRFPDLVAFRASTASPTPSSACTLHVDSSPGSLDLAVGQGHVRINAPGQHVVSLSKLPLKRVFCLLHVTAHNRIE